MASDSYEKYQVGVICALPEEVAAMRAALDEEHDILVQNDKIDTNRYHLGSVNVGNSHHGQRHNVVIAVMPAGVDGLVSAATVATHMARTFTGLRFGLLVGIGGGIPNLANKLDIRLGDVVVSLPTGTSGGVVQYDKGKSKSDTGFEHKGYLNGPPTVLLNALNALRAEHFLRPSCIPDVFETMLSRYPYMREKFKFPGADQDLLYESSSDGEHLVDRKFRSTNHPEIHYGIIASGNVVVKDRAQRDEIRKKFNALCVEMEAAGLMNNFPCLVIRGICDYADAHKNDNWHYYAAAAAAAFAKELLLFISVLETSSQTTINEKLYDKIDQITGLVTRQAAHHQGMYEKKLRDDILDWVAPPLYRRQFEDVLSKHCHGTCDWFLSSNRFQDWKLGKISTLLCPGIPGAGKSVMASVVIDHLLSLRFDYDICLAYIFLKFELQQQQDIGYITRSLLRQILAHDACVPELVVQQYKARQHIHVQIPSKEAKAAFVQTVSRRTNVFLVFDALDESSELTRASLVKVLDELIKSENKFKNAKVRILITYRPGLELSEIMHDNAKLEIKASTIDQRHFLAKKFQFFSSCVRQDSVVQASITDSILRAANGMFLLTDVYAEVLKHKRRKCDIDQELNLIAQNTTSGPAGTILHYAPVYKQLFERIQLNVNEDQIWAMRMIAWVYHARRPLELTEMADALGMTYETTDEKVRSIDTDRPNLTELLPLCIGVLKINAHTKTVEFTHYTFREYLACSHYQPTWLLDAKMHITTVCIRSVLSSIDPDGRKGHASAVQRLHAGQSLLSYAALYWGDHVCDVQYAFSDRLIELLKNRDFVQTAIDLLRPLFGKWSLPYDVRPSFKDPQRQVITLVVYFNLRSVLPGQLAKLFSSHRVMYDPNIFKQVVLIACVQNHAEILHLLLNWEHSTRYLGQRVFETLKNVAGQEGRDRSLKVLIDIGARYQLTRHFYIHALLKAAQSDYTSSINSIMSDRIRPNIDSEQYMNGLMEAASQNSRNALTTLLANSLSFSFAASEYCSVLLRAVRDSSDEVLQELLTHDLSYHVDDICYRKAFICAADRLYVRCVRLFIEDKRSQWLDETVYEHALCAAILSSRHAPTEWVIEVILKSHAGSKALHSRSRAVLTTAVKVSRKPATLKMLLSYGIDVESLDWDPKLLFSSGWDYYAQILVEHCNDEAAINDLRILSRTLSYSKCLDPASKLTKQSARAFDGFRTWMTQRILTKANRLPDEESKEKFVQALRTYFKSEPFGTKFEAFYIDGKRIYLCPKIAEHDSAPSRQQIDLVIR